MTINLIVMLGVLVTTWRGTVKITTIPSLISSDILAAKVGGKAGSKLVLMKPAK